MKEIDWSNLSFGYMKTDYNVRINFREGEWGKLEISSSELINLHMAATCLHYGQEAFARRWNQEKWQERKKGKNVRTHIGRRRKA